MYCPNCGSFAMEGENFCANCGTNLVGGAAQNAQGVFYADVPTKKPVNKGLVAAIIAGGAVVIVAAVMAVILLIIPQNEALRTHNVVLKDLSDIASPYMSAADIEEVFGGCDSRDSEYLWYSETEESNVTFYDIPINSAICYYSGEYKESFVFWFHDEYANEVEDVLREKCNFSYNLGGAYHIYTYGDARITVDADYTYVNIDFSDD